MFTRSVFVLFAVSILTLFGALEWYAISDSITPLYVMAVSFLTATLFGVVSAIRA